MISDKDVETLRFWEEEIPFYIKVAKQHGKAMLNMELYLSDLEPLLKAVKEEIARS